MLLIDGRAFRVWTIEPCNCEDLIYGSASKRSYDENFRRKVLWARGFDSRVSVRRERTALGECMYYQEVL